MFRYMKIQSLFTGYRLLYLLAVLEMALFLTDAVMNGNEDVDTWSYYNAFDTLISGKLDYCRTPLYPLFAGGMVALFGGAGRIVIAILQCALYLWSVTWFRKLSEALIANRRLAYVLTAAYALYPGIVEFNCMVMTDVPSLAGVTALLWLTYKAYYSCDMRSALGAGAVMVLLMATRPVFLFLPLLFGLFWLIALSRSVLRRVSAASLGISVLAVALMGWYTMEKNRTYEVRTPTMTSCYNNYCLLREAGLIDLSETDNPRVVEVMDSILSIRPAGGTLLDNWSEVAAIENAIEYKEFDCWVRDMMSAYCSRLLACSLYACLSVISDVVAYPLSNGS